jgi:hypothetical protein
VIGRRRGVDGRRKGVMGDKRKWWEVYRREKEIIENEKF